MYSQNATSQGLEAGFAADTGAWLPCVSALVSFMMVNTGDKYIDRLDSIRLDLIHIYNLI